MSKYSFFWFVFSHIWTEYGDLQNTRNTGKYGPEKTPYWDIFYAVKIVETSFSANKIIRSLEK